MKYHTHCHVSLNARQLNLPAKLPAVNLLQKEIAEQLDASYWTVQAHMGRIYQKLHVHSRAQAVAKYLGRPR